MNPSIMVFHRGDAQLNPDVSRVLRADEQRVAELYILLSELGLDETSSFGANAPEHKYMAIPLLVPGQSQCMIGADSLAEIWNEILDKKITAKLSDLLFIEFWASTNYYSFNRELRQSNKGFKYSNTLLAIRKRVAYSLYEYARGLNWQQPVTYVTALKVARAYLRDSVGHAEAKKWKDFGQFSGKLGVATVLISGFELVEQKDASEAFQSIRKSLEFDNPPEHALPYFMEAAILSFNFTHDVRGLQSAIDFALGYGKSSSTSALLLSIAEATLHIALQCKDESQLQKVLLFVKQAESHTDEDVTDFLRIHILRGIVEWIREHDSTSSSADGLQIPFGYRTGQDLHPLLLASAKEVYREIRRTDRVNDPMVAGVLADLIVNSRKTLNISEMESLTAAVKYRENGLDFPSQLVTLSDRLLLASIKKDSNARLQTVIRLVQLSKDPRATAAVHMILADNIERQGPLVSKGNNLKLSEAQYGRLIELSIKGDSSQLWNLAAKSALKNANLTQIDLGGRSGVQTVGDYYGLVSEKLTYKQMDRRSFERASSRAIRIKDYLETHGYSKEFGVSLNLSAMEKNASVIVARRYIQGSPLMELFAKVAYDKRLQLTIKTAKYLALINKAESELSTGIGVRKQLKTKEVGRFLKTCGIPNSKDIFDKWWDVVKDAPMVTRRDSHLDNWLLDKDGRIIAIDLEATGSRPFGYDLAQITDDHGYFKAEDWDSRKQIFNAYFCELQIREDQKELCWRSYKAGVLARRLWAITSPERAKSFEPGEAEQRLLDYTKSVKNTILADISNISLQSLLEKRGLSSLPQADKWTTGAGRIRLSKQIAYELRHDENLQRDMDGWVRIDTLREKLGGATNIEIATIATDPRETRFEINENLIRARYGHSKSIRSNTVFDYELSPDIVLFHASPWIYAKKILDDCQGLSSQTRKMVHLTESQDEAVASGIRGGHPLIYETKVKKLKKISKAGTHTYLTPSVPAVALKVLPISSYWKELPALEYAETSTKDV